MSNSSTLTAGRVFRKVLILNYPSSEVVALLRQLNNQKIRNVALYSGNETLYDELRERKPFAIEFLDGQGIGGRHDGDFFDVIRENAFAVIAPKDGAVHEKLRQGGDFRILQGSEGSILTFDLDGRQ